MSLFDALVLKVLELPQEIESAAKKTKELADKAMIAGKVIAKDVAEKTETKYKEEFIKLSRNMQRKADEYRRERKQHR